MDLITQGAFKALVQLHAARVRGVRLPRMGAPDAQARRYSRALKGRLLADAMALVRAKLVPKLERMIEQSSRISVRTDADEIGNSLDEIQNEFLSKWSRRRMGSLVRPVAEEIERFQGAQLNRTLREAVGVDVVGSETWLESAVDEFTSENVALIKSIPTRFFDDLETNLKRELADGARWEELTGIIEERYSVAQSRAELIARDQAGKFFGDLNRVRQEDLGINRFTWRTMRDNRVREEHETRDGESFTWNDPPDGETPGEPVLCRCYAEPDLSALLDDQ
jgi:SPP1 gp7 family putative phage head morphogenesis protein